MADLDAAPGSQQCGNQQGVLFEMELPNLAMMPVGIPNSKPME